MNAVASVVLGLMVLALLWCLVMADATGAYAVQQANWERDMANQKVQALETEVRALRPTVGCPTYVIHC